MANKKAKKGKKPAKSAKRSEPAKKAKSDAALTDEELDGVAGGTLLDFATAVWSTLSSPQLTTTPTIGSPSLTDIWRLKR